MKDSICRKNNEKLSIIHGLWQGAFEDRGGFFTSTCWECVESDQIEMMEYIGENPSGIHKFDKLKWSCLHTISYCIHPKLMTYNVKRKHINTLKTLFLLYFKDSMHFSNGGNLPIHLACQMNNALILKIIIQAASEKLSQQEFNQMLNQVKKDKYWNYTPLMIAIKNNSIDCVKELCQYKCVIDGISKYKSRYPNYNSFEFACYYNNVDILNILCNVCNLKQLNLNSKEYLSYLKKLANYGSSKRYLQSKCAEFLDDFSLNPTIKHKQVISSPTSPNHNKTQLRFVCCNNHVLSHSMEQLITPKKCDICQKESTVCRECKTCASLNQEDSKLFPAIICQKCVIATSLWSMIVDHGTQSTNLGDEWDKIFVDFINTDVVNRVEFGVLY